MTALPRYASEPFRAWLFAIARNLLIDTHRRRRPTSSVDTVGDLHATTTAPDEAALAAEAKRELAAALATLSSTQRRIVELRLQGFTGVEIARELGMHHAAMKSAQYRAFAKLRERLEPNNDGPNGRGR